MPIPTLPPCPYCGAHNHEPIGQPLLSKNRQTVAVIIRCYACGREWKETYDLRTTSLKLNQE
ncbi:hypothetical protein [uncultured Halomonas sp.]|uniref:hypothetical protein n=1 Tax=uncultured Halomonas sp. TaxID=173971 RepID=UPI00262797BF|nr:hypothetical protein [uncultured Halomonas sp.]